MTGMSGLGKLFASISAFSDDGYYSAGVSCVSGKNISIQDKQTLEQLYRVNYACEIVLCSIGIVGSALALITLWHKTFSRMTVIYSFFLRWLICANLVDCVSHVVHGALSLCLPTQLECIATALRDIVTPVSFLCCSAEIALVLCMAGTQLYGYSRQYIHAPMVVSINETLAKWLVVPVTVIQAAPAFFMTKLFKVASVQTHQACIPVSESETIHHCAAGTSSTKVTLFNVQLDSEYTKSWTYKGTFVYVTVVRSVSVLTVVLFQICILRIRHLVLLEAARHNDYFRYSGAPDAGVRHLFNKALPVCLAACSLFVCAMLPGIGIYLPGKLLCFRIGDLAAGWLTVTSYILHYVHRALHAYLYCLVSSDIRVVCRERVKYCLRFHDRPDPIEAVSRRLYPRHDYQGHFNLHAIAFALTRS